MSITLLNENDMRLIMNMDKAISAVSKAASAYSNKQTDIPLRTNLHIKKYNGDSLFMYGSVPPVDALGIKLVSIFPDNPKLGLSSCLSTMILEDAKTGEVVTIMNGTYLTQLRTGALSGLATKLLSNENSKIFALIGTGGQATCQLEAVLSVRNIKEVRVYSRNQDKVKKFIDDFINNHKELCRDINFINSKNSDEAINNADIITTVTTSNDPVINGDNVKKGCHINAVGSYTKEMSEIDEKTILKSNKIYVDTLDGTINETGDFLKYIEKGTFNASKITGELGELVDKKIEGRVNSDEITFFETTGSAVFDLVTAEEISKEAKKLNLGTRVDL